MCVAVGNSLVHVNAKPVTRAEYNAAESKVNEIAAIRQAQAEERRETAQRELEGKKNEVRAELAKLGLSPQTIKAILDQVRQG